jgi:hypothetical protein
VEYEEKLVRMYDEIKKEFEQKMEEYKNSLKRENIKNGKVKNLMECKEENKSKHTEENSKLNQRHTILLALKLKRI